MKSRQSILRGLMLLLGVGLVSTSLAWTEPPDPAPPQAPAPDASATFEQKIRPILEANCCKCHNAEKHKGKLDMTSLERLAKGGGTGPVIEPGEPDGSLLFQLIQKDNEPHMPPEGQLSETEMKTIRDWIAGLPKDRPLFEASSLSGSGSEGSALHWSFQPIRDPALPELKRPQGVINEVDRFVLAKLQAKGLTFNPPASPRELIRRATFDLTGLPPTPEEVQAFLSDTSPDAYEKLLDRLLASPAYGERWGRHWLDVARYADSDGFEFDVDRPHAFRYRDYVIRSFNADKPYDRFILEQLAGDELYPYKAEALTATGFCRHGPTIDNQVNEKNRLDELDDVLSTTSSVFLGLTIGCARCHDHKYDPISQKNYYEMLAIFNSREKIDYNVGTPEERERLRQHNGQLHRRIQEHKQRLRDVETSVLMQTGPWRMDGQTLIHEAPLEKQDADPPALLLFGDPNWTDYILEGEVQARGEGARLGLAVRANSGADVLWVELTQQAKARSKLVRISGGQRQTLQEADSPHFKADGWTRVRIALLGDQVKVFIEEELLFDAPVAGLSRGCIGLGGMQGAARFRRLQVKRSDGHLLWTGLPKLAAADVAWEPEAFPRRQQQKLELERTTQRLEQEKIQPPLAMGIRDAGRQPRPTFLLLRGDHRMQGPEVKPGVPGCLTRQPLDFPETVETARSTGRRTVLARWIASPDHPLTARVIVNRIWQWHFERGLVETSSNFGLNGAKPSHPELLDWLARRFIQDGWQWKPMHKRIMLSAAYRQSSRINEAAVQVDPNNALLWRYPRKRIEAEALRDGILHVSGKLNRDMFGPGVKARIQPSLIATGSTAKWPMITQEGPEHWRRSVYLFVKRSVLHPLMEGFDAPDATQSCERRLPTNVPTQALMLMNSDFMHDQAGYLAERLQAEGGAEPQARVERGYWLVLGRPPTETESKLALRFIEEQRQFHAQRPQPERSAWTDFAHVLLNLNEFVYLP